MGVVELLLIALGLSMDAFAVSVGKGLSVQKIKPRHSLSVGVWFGGFQALMPLVGYFLGVSFASMVESFDHWIAFILLGIIGFNMIREALSDDECEAMHPDFSARSMLMMAIATSIDALAVGVSFAFLHIDIWSAAAIIGVMTFILSVVGLRIGNIFGCRYKSKAELAGGAILMIMGVKIVVEHTLL
ncbi:MAG: manganese efflux pump [Alistipes sp.]|nr:manganese efflux pump [Alistipes sp.]